MDLHYRAYPSHHRDASIQLRAWMLVGLLVKTFFFGSPEPIVHSLCFSFSRSLIDSFLSNVSSSHFSIFSVHATIAIPGDPFLQSPSVTVWDPSPVVSFLLSATILRFSSRSPPSNRQTSRAEMAQGLPPLHSPPQMPAPIGVFLITSCYEPQFSRCAVFARLTVGHRPPFRQFKCFSRALLMLTTQTSPLVPVLSRETIRVSNFFR